MKGMNDVSKVIKESRIGKYLILRIENIPSTPYKKLKINNELFNIVPSYDINGIAIETDKSVLNSEVEFVL